MTPEQMIRYYRLLVDEAIERIDESGPETAKEFLKNWTLLIGQENVQEWVVEFLKGMMAINAVKRLQGTGTLRPDAEALFKDLQAGA